MARSNITPPPSSPQPAMEDRRIRKLHLEFEARTLLLADGCRPCYAQEDLVWPPELRDEYHDYFDDVDGKIVSYWESLSNGPRTGLVLQRQLEDWKQFRFFQRKQRCEKDIIQLESEINSIRVTHQLEGKVCLSEPRKQSSLTTWMEFQCYHLIIYEQLKSDVEYWKDEVRKFVKEKEEVPYPHRSEEDTINYQIAYNGEDHADCKLYQARQHVKWHPVMRSWIADQVFLLQSGEP
ncbi:hypothetical protein N0V90_008683 [Kalmusia sp. IMI 367209]|nr:hypothetical protein N0V90_008683 [Kalmusia sp. IMI 367209]